MSIPACRGFFQLVVEIGGDSSCVAQLGVAIGKHSNLKPGNITAALHSSLQKPQLAGQRLLDATGLSWRSAMQQALNVASSRREFGEALEPGTKAASPH